MNSSPDQVAVLTNHFSQYISDHKKEFIERVLADRTRHVTVVMENIFQSQNASAVVRTCECMGIQDVHIIQTSARYSVNPKVLKGSHKWLDLFHYRKKGLNNTESCFNYLREKGYRIVVTSPLASCIPIGELDVDHKLALVMGNELKGSSDYAMDHADIKVRIPMYGFTESLNISVSAAICLNTLMPKIRAQASGWQLNEDEKNVIRLTWYKNIVRKSDVIEREFLSRMKNQSRP